MDLIFSSFSYIIDNLLTDSTLLMTIKVISLLMSIIMVIFLLSTLTAVGQQAQRTVHDKDDFNIIKAITDNIIVMLKGLGRATTLMVFLSMVVIFGSHSIQYVEDSFKETNSQSS